MSRTWQPNTPRSWSKNNSAFFEIVVRAMVLRSSSICRMVNGHELKNSLNGSGIEPPEIKIPLANRTNWPIEIRVDLRLTAERVGEEEACPCATENRPPTEAACLTLDS